MPLEVLQRHGSGRADVIDVRATPALRAALAEMCSIAHGHLRLARAHIAAAPALVTPAFLPVALAGVVLASMERRNYDPFRPIVIPPWRRLWLIGRAARNPRRIFWSPSL
jgi:phytoene synthase